MRSIRPTAPDRSFASTASAARLVGRQPRFAGSADSDDMATGGGHASGFTRRSTHDRPLVDRPIASPASPPAAPDIPSLVPPPGVVVRAGPDDLAYVVHLQKRNTDSLGFLPRVALREKIDRGQIWLARENGDPAGFLHHGSLAAPEIRLFQAAIQYDARRRHLGLALVQNLVDRATVVGAFGVSLRCLSFLDANDFWRQAGFDLHAAEPGAKGTLNVWTKRLRPDNPAARTPFAFRSRLHPCPACGAMTMDTWTRGARRLSQCRRCVRGG